MLVSANQSMSCQSCDCDGSRPMYIREGFCKDIKTLQFILAESRHKVDDLKQEIKNKIKSNKNF